MFRAAERGTGLFLTRVSPGTGMPGWLAFRNPIRTLVARTLPEVGEVLNRAEVETARGRYVAGYLAYEAAPAFDRALTVRWQEGRPLAVFSVYDRPPIYCRATEPTSSPPMHLSPAWGEGRYQAAFHEVKRLLGEGTVYQVNLTFPLVGEATGDPLDRFLAMVGVRPPPYATYFEHTEGTVLSLSPELFFEALEGTVTARPMKGTAPRRAERKADIEEARGLQLSEKGRAENLMIADMVRNDLGRIAKIGSVTVPRLFEVERFDTVWQMSTEVRARFEGTVSQLFAALFPCASVTGAPKVRATAAIAELEDSPRGVYCGALGYLGPEGARFSVPIRTLEIEPSGQATYGVGSGIVWDSDAEAEWKECLLKAERLDYVPEPFALLETMRSGPSGKIERWSRHCDRLARSAAALGVPFDPPRIEAEIEAKVFEAGKVRLRLLPDGRPLIETAPLPSSEEAVTSRLASAPVRSDDPLLIHKTTLRDAYETELSRNWDLDDVLFWNERGEATEFSIGNLVVRRGDRWVTPPLSSGLLPGVVRAEAIAQGRLEEEVIGLEEVRRAPEIARINALRGWQAVRLVPL